MKKLLCLMLFCLLLNSTIYAGNRPGFMTTDQKDALDGANAPSASNVLATMDDVGALDTGVQTVTPGVNLSNSGDADNPILDLDITEDVDMDSHVLQNLNEIKPAGSGLFIYPKVAEGDIWTNFAMFGATDTTYGRLLAAYGKTPGASEFIWMAHDGTDGKVVSGTGGLILKDASNEVTVENLTQVTQTLYVDGNRSDSYTESGHITKPYKTIQAAITATAAAGNTLLVVAPGTYAGDFSLGLNVAGIRGSGLNATIFTGHLTAGDRAHSLEEFRITNTGSLTVTDNIFARNLQIQAPVTVSGTGFLDGNGLYITSSAVTPLTITSTSGAMLFRSTIVAGDVVAINQTAGTFVIFHGYVTNNSLASTTIDSSGGICGIIDTSVANSGFGSAISMDNDGAALQANTLNGIVCSGNIVCGAATTYVEGLNFVGFGALSGTNLIYKPASRISYDNAISGLTATNVKTAIDELEDNITAKEISFCIPGDAYVTTKIAGILVGANLAGETISKVKIYADTAPTGASLIVDVNKNGMTLFTTQNKRPEIAIGANADDSDTPDVTTLSEGDRLTIDIDQIGSTIAGGDFLYITIIMVK